MTPFYRAPVRPWSEPEPSTVRRWPIAQPTVAVEPGYHSAEHGGRQFIAAAVIIARERWRARPHGYVCRFPEHLCQLCELWAGHPVHRDVEQVPA